jgi:small subunit ribosomal protein S7
MPRRREVPKRKITPDPKYGDRIVAKFANVLMFGGKKSTAEQLLYVAFNMLGERAAGEDPLKTFKKAIDNVKPMIEVKSRRVGGATYQVPVEVRAERRTALAMRWLITYARARGERTMAERLAGEFLDAAQNRGNAVKKREDTHRMAEANKAFAHYRW